VTAALLGLLLAAAPAEPPVRALHITILSTMLADAGIGEWGFAALVEVDGHRILFDTGARPDTVKQNAHELGIDLDSVRDVVLSHNHNDHVGGLLSLRRDVRGRQADALTRAHVATGIFWSRPSTAGEERNVALGLRSEYEASGGNFVEHKGPEQIFPGVWVTGPVPRVYPERNWSGDVGRVVTPTGAADDSLPEDMSLVFDTPRGLVVLTGCGHAGIVNTAEHARKSVRAAPLYAVVGGLHLFELSDEKLEWTAGKLRDFGLMNLIGAHCTGIEAVHRIRALAGLSRKTAVVGAVGASFDLEKGIDPLSLAR
jgi:7,8-dihydropterin-6-yl-methyl-4-(beta-D-ribofuranosyl)aminobenzene 5'-phosphate synthase